MQCLDRSVAIFVPPALQVPFEELIFVFHGHTPQMPPGPHGHVDDARRPDIDGPRVEFRVDVLFRSDVRGGAAQPHHHVCLLFPRHPEAFPIAKVGDLESTVGGKQQVLGFQISMGHSHLVKVFHSPHQLLEVAVGLDDLELSGGQDERVEITSGTKLHHLAVVPFRILQQIEGVDNIRMPEGRRDAEFRGQALLVFLRRLLRSPAELLDRVQLFAPGRVSWVVGLVGYSDHPERAAAHHFLAFAVFLNQTGRVVRAPFLVGGKLLALALQLVDPGGHQGQVLFLATVSVVLLLTAHHHVAKHPSQFLLSLCALQQMGMGSIGVQLETLVAVIGPLVSFVITFALLGHARSAVRSRNGAGSGVLAAVR